MARLRANSSDFTPVVLGRVVAAGPVHILLTLSVGMTPGCAEAWAPVIRNVNNSGFLLSGEAPCLPPVPGTPTPNPGCDARSRCAVPPSRGHVASAHLQITSPEPDVFQCMVSLKLRVTSPRWFISFLWIRTQPFGETGYVI